MPIAALLAKEPRNVAASTTIIVVVVALILLGVFVLATRRFR